MKKNQIFKTVLILCGFVFLLFIFITIQAIVETPNWNWFDIDYTNKEKIVSGYSALLAAILSSLSIILLVYTIYLQNRESRKQSKRFKKEHKLQKVQFELDNQREEKKERLELFDRLSLLSFFLGSVIRHIEETGTEIRSFFIAEKEHPLYFNNLQFLVNKNLNKLIQMDYLLIYKAFRLFLKEDKNWIRKFNQVFSLVGFYQDALEELRKNFTYHKDDKFSRKNKMANDLKNIMDEAARIIDRYKRKYENAYLQYPFSSLINDFIPAYYEFIENDGVQQETNLEQLSQSLLLDFLKTAMDIRKQEGFDDLGSEELVSSVSSLRKDIYRLRTDCLYFAENTELRYDEYFSDESESLIKLKSLKKEIDNIIKSINSDNI